LLGRTFEAVLEKELSLAKCTNEKFFTQVLIIV